jgi:hypothetical protein
MGLEKSIWEGKRGYDVFWVLDILGGLIFEVLFAYQELSFTTLYVLHRFSNQIYMVSQMDQKTGERSTQS